jgi:hypothetical protein
MAKVGLAQLKDTLNKNVAIIRFTRRRPKAQKGPTRRMLCTNDQDLLNSINGRITLNYKPPTGKLKFNPFTKNLLVTWDIIMQDWRLINMNNCDLQETIKSDEFWEYFNEKIRTMSMDEKIDFMY